MYSKLSCRLNQDGMEGREDIKRLTSLFLTDSSLQTTRQSLRVFPYKVSHLPKGVKMVGWEEFVGGKQKCLASGQSTGLPTQPYSQALQNLKETQNSNCASESDTFHTAIHFQILLQTVTPKMLLFIPRVFNKHSKSINFKSWLISINNSANLSQGEDISEIMIHFEKIRITHKKMSGADFF